MEVVSHDGKRVIWVVVNNHLVEDPSDNDEIGLRGFGFNFLTKTRRG